MFWSGNYIAVRELNFLLKEENVTLTQVLEADDILQECKADNKALMQFLTKPKILAELITLITEEPPKNVELGSQYRHASIACEVLTSHLSSLSDRLSMDVVQMNRLCDFINKDPPLNPLLASYFSKTVEMLLERSPKQDWYLYHIVCLRVLDFFKSRRDFLPNLLRHISTSAIADTFKYFIRLDDLFNKIIMEWFEEHQFLECLIQIVCGTYEARAPELEKGQREPSEKPAREPDAPPSPDQDTDKVENNVSEAEGKGADGAEAADGESATEARAARLAGVASANAAALLCDLILSGCAGEGCNTRPRTSWALVSRLQSAEGARLLLQGIFTAPPRARPHALVHGAHVLLALLDQEPILGGEAESMRTSVELAVAPHLPLLHQALLEPARGVGLPRVQVAALLAHLALSEVEEVAATMLTLGQCRMSLAAAAPGLLEPARGVGLPRVQVAALLAHLALSEVEEVAATMLTLGQCRMSLAAAAPGLLEPARGVGLPRVQVAALLAHLALSEVEEVAATMLTLGQCRMSLAAAAPGLLEPARGVGLPRVQVAALLAHLALSEVEEVAATMLTLGTPGVLLDMMFAHAHNNFLHAQVHALVKHALANRAHRAAYARHLLRDAHLLARLMDAVELNDAKGPGEPRDGYMGHVVLMLRRVGKALEEEAVAAALPAPVAQRWAAFRDATLAPLLQRHDTPLGGYYPSESIYEFNDVTATASLDDMPNDINADAYNEMCGANDSADFLADELDLEDGEKGDDSKNNFLELASQRFDDDMWEDSPEADEAEGAEEAEEPMSRVRELLDQHSPWESGSCGGGGEGWAQFEARAEPFAPPAPFAHAAFWSYDATDKTAEEKLDESMAALRLADGGLCSVQLASQLLSCMGGVLPSHAGLEDGQQLAHGFDDQSPLQNDIQGVDGFPEHIENSRGLHVEPAATVGTQERDTKPSADDAHNDDSAVNKDEAPAIHDQTKDQAPESTDRPQLPTPVDPAPASQEANDPAPPAPAPAAQEAPPSVEVNDPAPQEPRPPSPQDAPPAPPSPPAASEDR
ncbi:serine/threonine-protein phosphatase 6 regulatory subunit 1 [Ostrinia furnacalis]|uniref:serine/threonine-protein phosphatase 6 regulatory subunit 1 n=1 Tax=Ostrinia furnacalis TaxID=93504 RepID=UPI00103A8738|nr:serine/threonine-protein phosphatase 6 regulatory subunit 1 [Ostrinia furnacalis]